MIRSAALLGGVALALALAGCAGGGAGGDASATPAPSVSVGTGVPSPVPTKTPLPGPTPAPTRSPAGSGAEVSLTVHMGAPPAGTRLGPTWTVRSADPARSSVEIAWFDLASPGCGIARDAWVDAMATTVTIDLVRSPRRTEIMCPAVLVPRHAVIPLGAPLGDRRLTEHPAASVPLPAPSCRPTPGPLRPAIACPLVR